MEGTTNIFDLPPATAATASTPISIATTNTIPPAISGKLDDDTRTELLGGLGKLSAAGLMGLPNRDISLSTHQNVVDENTVVNHIPRQASSIPESGGDDVFFNKSNTNQSNYIDDVYNEVQTPIFVGLLFFLLQLPAFKKYLFYFFPNLMSSEGSYNLGGYFFVSILFSLIYYILQKIQGSFR